MAKLLPHGQTYLVGEECSGYCVLGRGVEALAEWRSWLRGKRVKDFIGWSVVPRDKGAGVDKWGELEVEVKVGIKKHEEYSRSLA